MNSFTYSLEFVNDDWFTGSGEPLFAVRLRGDSRFAFGGELAELVKLMTQWCTEQFGPEEEARWGFEPLNLFLFADREALMLFKLAWS